MSLKALEGKGLIAGDDRFENHLIDVLSIRGQVVGTSGLLCEGDAHATHS